MKSEVLTTVTTYAGLTISQHIVAVASILILAIVSSWLFHLSERAKSEEGEHILGLGGLASLLVWILIAIHYVLELVVAFWQQLGSI